MESEPLPVHLPLSLGQVVVTQSLWRGLLIDLDESTSLRRLAGLLERHRRGDWGELDESDRCANDRALVHGGRVLSSYLVSDLRVWCITEADRSATTLLLPEDY